MLALLKNNITSKLGFRNGLMVLFGIAVLVGVGVPYFGLGGGTTVSAISATDTNASQSTNAVVYVYKQMSLRDVYPYYIAASFMVAGGLSLYAVTYIPSRAERRSRYVSRFETYARTTY